ncbi:MAG TPA: hypothetical protein VE135_16595 [Pyrinomonadaceae bacterium]|nr:hypothetical protein [Pyrinomonadaceae bacterium]
MTNSSKQTISAAMSLGSVRALVNSPRAERDLATVTVLIAISLVVTKDST